MDSKDTESEVVKDTVTELQKDTSSADIQTAGYTMREMYVDIF
jgi:hypothetical protein